MDTKDNSILGGVDPSRVLDYMRMTDARFAAGWNTAMAFVYSGDLPCALCQDELQRRGQGWVPISLEVVEHLKDWSPNVQFKAEPLGNGLVELHLRTVQEANTCK